MNIVNVFDLLGVVNGPRLTCNVSSDNAKCIHLALSIKAFGFQPKFNSLLSITQKNALKNLRAFLFFIAIILLYQHSITVAIKVVFLFYSFFISFHD